jgi:4-hydroxy-3-methylbut-2-enyl diphosphate reductase IspH
MRLKSELYKNEQLHICDQIIKILELDDSNSTTLYELDNNKNKQTKILDLIPDIRKYFSFTSIIGASEPEKVKRPWLSIIRNITKMKYDFIHGDYVLKKDNERVRTKKYVFLSKQ